MCVKISYEISGWVRLGNAAHIQVLMFKLFSNLFVKSPNWPGSNKMEKKNNKKKKIKKGTYSYFGKISCCYDPCLHYGLL